MRTSIVATTVALMAAGLLAATPTATANDGATSAAARSAPPATTALAGGAVTLGEVGNSGPCLFTVPYGLVLDIEDAARPSYIAPFTGVLTSYSTLAGANPGNVRALVLKAGADATHKVLTAKTEQHPVVASTLNTVPARVPIKTGERIALGLSAIGMSCGVITTLADTSRAAQPFDADTSTDFAYSPLPVDSFRPNISAVLEPDVDGDLYGDVSQDLCPKSKLTHAACPPPDTTVTKQPKKRSTKSKATIKFTSTIAGSTFTCALDGKAAKVCGSPYKKRFTYGKHVVLITAISPFGIADPTPAQVKFKVKRPA
jgi:hypothetical protein